MKYIYLVEFISLNNYLGEYVNTSKHYYSSRKKAIEMANKILEMNKAFDVEEFDYLGGWYDTKIIGSKQFNWKTQPYNGESKIVKGRMFIKQIKVDDGIFTTKKEITQYFK